MLNIGWFTCILPFTPRRFNALQSKYTGLPLFLNGANLHLCDVLTSSVQYMIHPQLIDYSGKALQYMIVYNTHETVELNPFPDTDGYGNGCYSY